MRRSRNRFRSLVVVLVVASGLCDSLPAERVVYLDAGLEWRYLPGLTEASSPDPTSWRLPDFADGAWALGTAPFGYGRTPPYGTDLAALDPPMQGNYTSLFLRRTFDVADKKSIVAFEARVLYDDAFILWINGVEVASALVPGVDGEFVPHDAVATRSHTAAEFEAFPLEDPASFLVNGANTIALQVFNRSMTNSDLKIDLELVDPFGPDLVPPLLELVLPVPGSTVRRLSQVEVTFDEEVTGLEAADLLINGVPALAVDGEGAGPWVFSVATPANGPVQVTWAAGHGITDTAPARNEFAGDGWTFTLDPDAQLPDLVISEFLAANGSGLLDENRDAEDWIEIYNRGDQAVNLIGMSLTDDASHPGLWTFPDTTLAPQEHLIVFASAKDRSEAGAELHTNFKLREAGEYLGLFSAEAPRQTIFEFAPEFPTQRFNHSYGLTPTGGLGYFATPTPGVLNADTDVLAGLVKEPVFTPGRGIYDEAVIVTLTSRTPGTTIYYTLDGSVPTPESAVEYTGELEVAGSPERGVVTLRAAAYKKGLLPSEVVTHSYVFPNAVIRQPRQPTGFPTTWPGTLADYEVDARVVDTDPALAIEGLTSIPTVSIVTHVDHLFSAQTGIYANPSRSGDAWERPTSAELIYPDGRQGFQLNCGIRTQGGSSVNNWKSKKVSMRLLFKGDYGAKKLRFPVFPDYAVERFDFLILDASLNLVWNHPGTDQQSQAQYVRDQFVADLQNEAGGHAPRGIFVNLYLNGLYWGQYGLHERPDASFAAENFGGDKSEYDAIKHQAGRVVDGNATAFNQMMSLGRVVQDRNQFLALDSMLDISDYAAYMLINFWAGNTDWAHQNWYATRKRVDGAQFLFHSWDAEHVLKNVGENRFSESRGPAAIFQALRQYDEFQVLFGDIVHRHFFNGGIFHVDPDNPEWDSKNPERNRPASLYMKRADEIGSSIFMESARWGDVNRPGRPYTRDDWLRELTRLETSYLPQRSAIVLNQARSLGLYPRLEAPVFGQHGGEIDPGFTLTLELPEGAEGTIYYTTDGTDPRLASGDVSARARTYEGPVVLHDSTVVKARNLDEVNDVWSAMNEAVFKIPGASPDRLLITEIMYNPPGGSDYEFIEIHNPTAFTIDLGGLAFTGGITYSFGERRTLAPGGYLVLVASAEAFSVRHSKVEIGGVYNGKLANGGEKVTLSDATGATLTSVEYDDESFWPLAADGFGHSLVLADPERDLDDPRAWSSSRLAGGSPRDADLGAAFDGVIINEVVTVSLGANRDEAVELHNLTESAVDVGGWFLSPRRDDDASLMRFMIPAGTEIAPGGYLVISAERFNFLIDPSGGGLYLSSSDGRGGLGGYIVGVEFGAGEPGVSFGRHETSTGLEFSAMGRMTLGEANSEPRRAPVVINEIHYHPPDLESEFIELFNATDSDVSLTGWRMSGISGAQGEPDFLFPAGTTIPAAGYLLLVSSAPESFRAVHDIPAGVAVVGPYGGALDNDGERLRLLKPALGAPDARVTVDMVRFNDREPWAVAADGQGPSLERLHAAHYGNEALNWDASTENGGTPGARNSVSPPVGSQPRQIPGDVNRDGRINISDPALLLKLLIRRPLSLELPCAGTIEDDGNRSLLDATGDRMVNITDAVHMLNFLFRRGPEHTLGMECVEIADCADACASQ